MHVHEAAGAFANALLILDEEAECCAQHPQHTQPGGTSSSKDIPFVAPEATATSAGNSSSVAFHNVPQDSSGRGEGMHGRSPGVCASASTASPKTPPKPLSLSLVIERHHIALSCICNLCYIHMQRNDPHACIACANAWFRRPLTTTPVATNVMQLADSASVDMEWLQGVWKLLEDSLQHRRCVESAVHLAGYIGEALCMLAAPQAAVEVLLWGLSGLARRTARDHVRFDDFFRVFRYTEGFCARSAAACCVRCVPTL